jgi:hypothetical protein
VQRPDDVQRHTGLRAGRVDGELGRVAQRLDPVGAAALSLEAFAPSRRRLRREVVEGEAVAARIVLVHPGAEARGVELGEGQQQVAHVALRVEHEAGNASEQRLFDQIDRKPGLPRAGHAEDDPVRGQVARLDDQPLAARLARLRIETEAEMEISHYAASLERDPFSRARAGSRGRSEASGAGAARAFRSRRARAPRHSRGVSAASLSGG